MSSDGGGVFVAVVYMLECWFYSYLLFVTSLPIPVPHENTKRAVLTSLARQMRAHRPWSRAARGT
jgi:hypothetical protein